MNIRNSVKALIVQDGKLLMLRCRNARDEHFEDYFVLPGGGQHHGETFEQALRRECQEEVNVEVEVKNLVYIREYIGKNHGFARHNRVHQIDFHFIYTITAGQPAIGHTPDTDQIGVAWNALSDLENINFYPRTMRKLLASELNAAANLSHVVYLGDIN